MTLLDNSEKARRDRALIELLIDDPSRLGPDYQPIKRLDQGAVIAYKATGRGQKGTDLDNTLALLEGAQSTGLVERLDWAFRCLAFDQFLATGLTADLHLTLEPETFGSACPPRLATSFGRGRRELSVGVEVHDYCLEHPRLDSAVAEWRSWGWQVVLADVSHVVDGALLKRLDALRPDVVQVDVSRAGAGGPQVQQVLAWASANGAALHATGVDLEARRALAVDLGAVAGRGRLLGPAMAL